MVTLAKSVLEASETGLATAATKYVVEQQLPTTIPSNSWSTGYVADVVIVSAELKCLQCSPVVLVLDFCRPWRSRKGGRGANDERIAWSQPDDTLGRSKVRF